ncbi:MAG TPA: cyclic nucleotide-binding domain-containing protein [Puia sp.]|jgi:signal-transduction protein with cAMP-binding, CBS, and nucleotidyltransferase domain
MIQVFRYLRSIQPHSPDFRDHIEDILKEKKLKRKEYLLKVGHNCGNIYFVDQGLLRAYYIKGKKEISHHFFKEGEICVDVDSFLSQQYSMFNIQALEDCTLYFISYAELQHIYARFSEFEKVSRILIEKCHIIQIQRFQAMWMQPSEDRYKWLSKTFPDFHQRIPAKYLASYIGVTEGQISNIKNHR